MRVNYSNASDMCEIGEGAENNKGGGSVVSDAASVLKTQPFKWYHSPLKTQPFKWYHSPRHFTSFYMYIPQRIRASKRRVREHAERELLKGKSCKMGLEVWVPTSEKERSFLTFYYGTSLVRTPSFIDKWIP